MAGRIRAAGWLAAVLVVVACGGSGGAGDSNPPGGASTKPAASRASASAAAPSGNAVSKIVSPDDIASVLGESAPTPECRVSSLTQTTICRWTASDAKTSIQVEQGTKYKTEAEWREAFTKAGLKEEVPNIGVAALAGNNPFGGVRITAFTTNSTSWTVVVTKEGDRAALMASAVAILTKVVAAN